MNRVWWLGCLPLAMTLVQNGASAQSSGAQPSSGAADGTAPELGETSAPGQPVPPLYAPTEPPPSEQDQTEATEARLESMMRISNPNEPSPNDSTGDENSSDRNEAEEDPEEGPDDEDLRPPTPPPDEALRFSALSAVPLAGAFNPFLRLQQEYDIQPAELGGFRVGFRLAETIGQAWFLHAGGLLSAEYEWFKVDDFRVMAAISVSIGAMFGQLGTRVDTFQFDVMPALDIRCLWDPNWDLGLRVGAGISLVNTLDVGLTWAVRF